MSASLNVLSLFAGIGGMELGLERAGMTTVGQVEIDPYCQRVLARHWPEVPRHDDVLTTPQWWTSKNRPAVNLVCGGFPCQPFSLAGKQLGTSDERWMWPAFADVIRAVRPAYVLVENVASLVRDRLAFGTILADLHSLGFDAEWATVRASDYGAPTPRRRVYLLANAAGVNGIPWDRMGASRIGTAPFAARGLPSPPAHQRGRLASEWLAREPNVDRLAHGIPSQVDRLRTIGNAVVPAITEYIGSQLITNLEMAA